METTNSTVQSSEKVSSPKKIRSTNNKRPRPETNSPHEQNPKKRLKSKKSNQEPELEQKQSPFGSRKSSSSSRMTMKDSNSGNSVSVSGNSVSISGNSVSISGNSEIDDTIYNDIISNHRPILLKNELVQSSDNNLVANFEPKPSRAENNQLMLNMESSLGKYT